MKGFGKLSLIGVVAVAAPLAFSAVEAKAAGELDRCNPVYDKLTYPTDISEAEKAVRSKLSGLVVRHKNSIDCTAAAAPPNNEFLVFFDWNKANIRKDAADIIAQAATAAGKLGTKSIAVVGHTDTSGSTAYNQKLSERRALAVEAELAKRGISPQIVDTAGKGETELLTKTRDGVREATNRRATIVLK